MARVATRPVRVLPKAPAIGLEQAVSDYLATVQARGGSPRTLEYYESILNKIFFPWCAAEEITTVGQLTQATLDRLNVDLLSRTSNTGKALSRASVATYLRGIRQFIRWAQKERMAAADLDVQRIRPQGKLLEVLSREELARLEAAAGTERDKLIIRLFSDGGFRLNELLTLTTESLVEQRRERYVKVQGKGSRERWVPLSPAVYQRLKRFVVLGRPETLSDRIFVSNRRRPITQEYEPLDARAVQQLIAAAGRKAGFQRRVYPHMLRHSMITNALRKPGANPVTIAKIVGHSDLSMIQRTYAHLTVSDTHAEMMRLLRDED